MQGAIATSANFLRCRGRSSDTSFSACSGLHGLNPLPIAEGRQTLTIPLCRSSCSLNPLHIAEGRQTYQHRLADEQQRLNPLHIKEGRQTGLSGTTIQVNAPQSAAYRGRSSDLGQRADNHQWPVSLRCISRKIVRHGLPGISRSHRDLVSIRCISRKIVRSVGLKPLCQALSARHISSVAHKMIPWNKNEHRKPSPVLPDFPFLS